MPNAHITWYRARCTKQDFAVLCELPAEAILDEVRRNPTSKTALIIDYDGHTAEPDPDTFVLGRGRVLQDLPDMVVARPDLLNRINGLERAASIKEVGDQPFVVARDHVER
jgi:hypothetical protein